VEFGGTGDANLIKATIPPGAGLVPVVEGLPLTNSLDVAAFADEANKINIFGFVNRIT
jgi:hypothetical protein